MHVLPVNMQIKASLVLEKDHYKKSLVVDMLKDYIFFNGCVGGGALALCVCMCVFVERNASVCPITQIMSGYRKRYLGRITEQRQKKVEQRIYRHFSA